MDQTGARIKRFMEQVREAGMVPAHDHQDIIRRMVAVYPSEEDRKLRLDGKRHRRVDTTYELIEDRGEEAWGLIHPYAQEMFGDGR